MYLKNNQALLIAIIITVFFQATLWSNDGWRVMPIRSQNEFLQGKIGGEAEQFAHGMSRCLSDPNIIYLSHDVGQVWKSVDGGNSWKRTRCQGLWLTNGQSIAVDPINSDHVLVTVAASWNWLAADDEGVYRSTDGGDSWQAVLYEDTNFVSSAHRIFRRNITFDLTSVSNGISQRCYVALPGNGLYRSEDGGVNWSLASSLVGHSTIYEIAVHPSDGQTIFVASKLGLYKSDSKGANLQPYGDLPGGEVSSIEINPQNPDMVYVGLFGQGLYRSLNGGLNFSLLHPFDVSRCFMNPGFPETLYLVGQTSNTITSHDAGATWITDMVTFPAIGLGRHDAPDDWKDAISGRLTGLLPNPDDPNEAVASSRATLWKTTDGGQTFHDSSTLFTGFAWSWWNDAVAFDMLDPNRFAFFNADVGMVITDTASDWFDRRNDEARDWWLQGTIGWMGTYSGDIQPVPGSQIIVASVGDYFSTQLMHTVDSGENWNLVTTSSEQNLFIAFHPDDPNLVYAGDKISTDAGASFLPVNFGAFNTYNPSILGMCQANPDTVYALDSSRIRILRSDNRGATWTLYNQPGWNFKKLDSLPTFAVDPLNCDIIYTLNSGDDLAIYDGVSWRDSGVLSLAGGQNVGNFVRSVAVDPLDPNIVYAGMHAAGVPCIWRSLDKGFTWQDISYNLPRSGMGGMAVNPHTGELFRGSSFGTWVFPPPYESDTPIYDKLVSMPIERNYDMIDFSKFVQDWLVMGCDVCHDNDFTFDGNVLLDDLEVFIISWLKNHQE